MFKVLLIAIQLLCFISIHAAANIIPYCSSKFYRIGEEVEVFRHRCSMCVRRHAREGAPQARQVAGRVDLMQNLRLATEEQMILSGRATGGALLPGKRTRSAQLDPFQDDPHVDATHRRRVRHAHQQSRQMVVFDTVHALNEEGLSCSEIARRTYGQRIIAKRLPFETPPDRQKAALKPTSAYIARRPSPSVERWQSLRTASVLRHQTARLHGQFLVFRTASRQLAPRRKVGQGQCVTGSGHTPITRTAMLSSR